MPEKEDYAPVESLIYINADTRADREEQLQRCLFHVCTVAGEEWVAEPKFEKNLANAVEAIEENPPGRTDLSETDWHPPIQRLFIFVDKGGTGALSQVFTGTVENKPGGREYSVIVPSIDALSTRATGFDQVQRLLDAGNTVHLARTGIALTSRTDISGTVKTALMELSGVVHPSHENDTDEQFVWSGGRPPLGFRVADSGDRLVETEEHREIRRVLQQVVDGIKSKRRAARELDCTRSTVTACINDRPSMYSLDK